MRKLIVATIVLALTGVAAACGGDNGDSGETGGDDFAAQADAICIEGAEVAREANLELGYATKPEDLTERSERLLESRQAALDELEALEAPADLAGAYDEYVAARQNLVDATEELIAALNDGDTAAVEAADAAIAKAVKMMESAGAELDLDACAGVLPDDDAQAAEEVLLEYSTTTDAAVICKPGGIATETFVEDGFGGVKPCLNEQHKLASEPDSLPDDIEVTDVSGVDDVAASIEYEEVGGSSEGTSLSAQLFYVDGAWRIYSVFGG
ncbi:MAG TPA: hypothetical protein VD766_13755 [Solirubrobacterales bacterium]|nr:hypothetical protein [Solirubrobacterales bacterium]